jgi:S1-C subfamily serine protease
MEVPIDILEPILPDLLRLGRADRSPRPWLGMYTSEAGSSLIVGGLAENGPAARAGIEVGDRVLEVAGERVGSLADLFRRIWSRGPAGTEVPITVRRDGTRRTMQVRSADRNDFLKKPRLH